MELLHSSIVLLLLSSQSSSEMHSGDVLGWVDGVGEEGAEHLALHVPASSQIFPPQSSTEVQAGVLHSPLHINCPIGHVVNSWEHPEAHVAGFMHVSVVSGLLSSQSDELFTYPIGCLHLSTKFEPLP